MCGIGGIWGHNSGSLAEKISSMMFHRGPDGNGIWHRDLVTLVHRRLAINDLGPEGEQPMISKNGDVAITVNGEIYNYSELRGELERDGAIFKGHCDSEVVLHAWQRWGDDCFARLNGMFAIGLYDSRARQLIIARDRLGIKPVYYITRGDNFYFASEIKALLTALSETPRLDRKGLAQYLTFANYAGSQSLYEDVKLLEPGTSASFSEDGLKLNRYWDIASIEEDPKLDFQSSINLYRTKFRDSVKRHLMSDVPIGAYLSAGIDSASIAAEVSDIQRPPACFTGSFAAGGWYDESTFAKQLAERRGSEHTSVPITSKDFPAHLDELIVALDEPRMGMGALPQLCVAKAVSRSRKVVLTGHGGDELFSGYPIFKLANLLSQSENPIQLARQLFQFSLHEIPHAVYFILAMIVRERGSNIAFPVLMNTKERKRALKSEWFGELEGFGVISSGNRSRDLMKLYINTYLNGLLVVEDKISMHQSIESRTPLLDNDLIELALQVPQHLKIRNGELKAIPRTFAREILPRASFTQPKRGFPTPLRYWLRGELKGWMREKLTGKTSSLRLVFEEPWLNRVVETYLNSKTSRIRPLDEIPTQRIYMLLSLESWLRQNPGVA